jgi:uncharacterized protein YndB with AHSA1/START domain
MATEPAVRPIQQSATVRRPVEEAFRIFTEEIGSWWPLASYSKAYSERSGERVTAESVVLEGRVGGQIYEVMSDGTEASWGEVVAWDPPNRLVLAWNPQQRQASTEVEVRFTAQTTAAGRTWVRRRRRSGRTT